jgi:hypothetical protein
MSIYKKYINTLPSLWNFFLMIFQWILSEKYIFLYHFFLLNIKAVLHFVIIDKGRENIFILS